MLGEANRAKAWVRSQTPARGFREATNPHQNQTMTHKTLVATVALAVPAACGGGHTNAATSTQAGTTPAAADQTPAAAPATVADTTATRHHSVLAGAAVGAAGGHMLGHHAILGAAAGALIQHERNKHAARP